MNDKNYPLYEIEPFGDFKEMLDQRVKAHPDHIAFKYTYKGEDKSKTYKEFREEVNALGTGIANLGIDNVHIAMVGENCYEWILTQLTVLGSNNVYVPIDKDLHVNELCNVIDDSDSEVIFTTPSYVNILKENISALPKVKHIFCYHDNAEELIETGRKLLEEGSDIYTSQKPEDMALGQIVYTSGTTGKAKGVMLSRHNLVSSIYYGMMTMTVFSVSLSVLPYNHTYESTCDILVSLHKGATICINENLRTVADNLKKYRPDYVMLVPLFVENFYKKIWKTIEKAGKANAIKRGIAISNALRKVGIDVRKSMFKDIHDIFGGQMIMIVCGGAPIRPELAAFFDGVGISLINGYGITECSPLLATNRQFYNNFRSVGVPLSCVDVKIANPNEDGEGEIVVKGDIVMMGYYKNEAATKEVLTEDGWFSTGDYGKFIKDQLYITGRKKNLIVLKNGKNVYPEEIEEYIADIEGLEEHVVYSVKDERGEEVSLCAEIYPERSFAKDKSDEELSAYFQAEIDKRSTNLPAYKQVHNVKIRHEEFPKTTSKKIKRQGLGQ